jgi:hypothetical protein
MTKSIAEALSTHDEGELREALRSQQVAMLLTEGEEGNVPAVITDDTGVRAVAVFTSQAAFKLWGRPEVVGMVPGSEVASIALSQGVDQVLFDPAGPAPVGFAPAALEALAQGVVAGEDEGPDSWATWRSSPLGPRKPTDCVISCRTSHPRDSSSTSSSVSRDDSSS